MTADAAPRTSIEEQAQHRLAATKLVPEQMFVWHVLRPSPPLQSANGHSER